MHSETPVTGWKLGFCKHSEFMKMKAAPTCGAGLQASGIRVINASVPGNFELDLAEAGIIEKDIYRGDNVFALQKLEDLHLWYYAGFLLEDRPGTDPFLRFGGVDTAAEYYLDGEYLGSTENMLIPHEFSLSGIAPGSHEITVHITPAAVYCQENAPYDSCRAQGYNLSSLAIRKAPYMFGWDIMPRAVSGGLWKPVSVIYKPAERIVTSSFRVTRLKADRARVRVSLNARVAFDGEYSVRVTLSGHGSPLECTRRMFDSRFSADLELLSPRLWQPKNYGDPALYDLKLELIKNGAVIDRVEKKVGVRVVELDRTARSGPEGRFRFVVNGEPVYVMGTNWVPTDVFPSRHGLYTQRALEMADDLGCNMIRCWGGNVYCDDEFFDFCDSHGIMVWQDFAMACGIYPRDKRFISLIKQEAESVVLRLRDHPCLVLWSGDNECDQFYRAERDEAGEKKIFRITADDNLITRSVIPEILRSLDPTRPYLPSSPYLEGDAFIYNDPAEDHLWGPRDWFKGDYYNKNSVCHFASETGYHGCPAPESLARFIDPDHLPLMGGTKLCEDPQWLAHSASPESDPRAPYAYRIPLMIRQAERLFGDAEKDLGLFSLQSQISQGEALKFFIEHFRIQKPYRSGLIWWNLIDGWPQISDAVVDWYGVKKLAYNYIKRAQSPFLMAFDEPDENSRLTLVADNESPRKICVTYTVRELISGRTVLSGSAQIPPRANLRLDRTDDVPGFYLISWTGDADGVNHFVSHLGAPTSFEDYRRFMPLWT